MFAVLYGVLLSPCCYRQFRSLRKNRSQKKMLNNKDPRMDPCGTPNKISSQGLYDKFTLVLWFLFVK